MEGRALTDQADDDLLEWEQQAQAVAVAPVFQPGLPQELLVGETNLHPTAL